MSRAVPLILAVALFMEQVDSTVISTALPVIADDLGASPIALKLALTAYYVALAVFIPVSGWMADRYGASTATFDSVIRGGQMDRGFYQTFMGYALEGNREAHRFTLSNAYKDLRYLESMANAATITTTMASAAKNSFAGAVAQGGAGPEDYVPHLTDFVARANGVR
jgi:3-hydroxyisobutyrate dehydrogenase-like beta-hydroxyacid dehydrogenase